MAKNIFLVQKFYFRIEIAMLYHNFDCCPKLLFWLKIFSATINFDVFFTISIFDQNSYFGQNFIFWPKISIFEFFSENIFFAKNICLFLSNLQFVSNLHFLSNLQLLSILRFLSNRPVRQSKWDSKMGWVKITIWANEANTFSAKRNFFSPFVFLIFWGNRWRKIKKKFNKHFF